MFNREQLAQYFDIVGPIENIEVSSDFSGPATQYKTHLNSSSGRIFIDENVFFGANVMLLAGSHDYNLKGLERKAFWYQTGYDITIEQGVWIASGAIIIGPCKIGENSVIGAGSVVTKDVPANQLWLGNPAEFVKELNS